MTTLVATRTVTTVTLVSLFILLPTFTTHVNAIDWTIMQLGEGHAPAIDGYKVAWMTGNGIELYDILKETTTLIPNSGRWAIPFVSGQRVVWKQGGYVWLYDGSTSTEIVKLDTFGPGAELHSFSGNHVTVTIYEQPGPWNPVVDFHFYDVDAKVTTRVIREEEGVYHHVSGGQMVWVGDGVPNSCGIPGPEIFMWDGFAVSQVTDNNAWDQDCNFTGGVELVPRTSGSTIVWMGGYHDYAPEGLEIYFWNGSTIQVTDNKGGDQHPDVSGNNIAWLQNYEDIRFYNAATGENELVAAGVGGGEPRISGYNVVWSSEGEVFLAVADNQDQDGDGLLDIWERAGGVDWDQDGSTDLALPGADPLRKNLYVEVDAMAGLEPSQDALDLVVASFRRAPVWNPGQRGIILHIDNATGDTVVAAADWNIPGNELEDSGEFKAAKRKYLGTPAERTTDVTRWNNAIKPARLFVYRYCIFADQFNGSRLSGLADDAPGADFIVTLGAWKTRGGTLEQQAGTFMHELGHSLGLDHGGPEGDDVAFKPNYFSVMNYAWQSPQLPYADSWRLDYSRMKLPTLDENRLLESESIGGPKWMVPVGPQGFPEEHCKPILDCYPDTDGDGLPDTKCPYRLVFQNGPVDWDCDGTIDTSPVSSCWGQPCDINHIRTKVPNPNSTVLEGHDDWKAELHYLPNIAASGSGGGAVPLEESDANSELSFDMVLELGGPGTSPMSQVIAPASLEQEGSLGPFHETFAGIALANPNDYESELRVKALNSDGQERALKLEMGNVPSQGQKANVTSELLDKPSEASCLMAEGSPPEVKGFFMVGNYDLRRLDGVGGFLRASDELYFPVIQQTETDRTYLFLFNPSLTPDQYARLSLFDEDGQFQAEKTVQLAGLGSLEGTLDEIFEETIDLEKGYIEVKAQMLLRGFEFLGDTQAYHSLTAQPVDGTDRLVAPHFYAARNGGSTLRLLNVGDKDVSATLKGYNDSGEEMGTAEITINPRKLYNGSLAELLGIDTSELGEIENIVGYLTVEMTDGTHHLPKVIGSLTFHGNDGKWVSTLPLLSRGRNRTLFLHVAHSAELEMFTGVAILNAGDTEATVTVEVYDENGDQSGTKELTIAAGTRVVDILSGTKLFGPGFEQVKGHIKLLSDLPVMSFALFGGNDLRFMSAIEGQE